MLWMTKPPAKASSENSADSRSTTPFEPCKPQRLAWAAAGGASTAGDIRVKSTARSSPTAA